MDIGTTGTTSALRFAVRLDSRRRPTLPAALLDSIGVGPGDSLIASLGPDGRIILEKPSIVAQRVRDRFQAPRVSEEESA